MNRININTLKEIKSELGGFDINQMNDKTIYLRFGYWSKVNINVLNSILAPFNAVIENDIYDDDCGYKYFYTVI